MSSKIPRYISAKEVNKASDLKSLIDEIRFAYFKQIEAEVPKRSLILRETPFSAFLTMSAYSEFHGLFITKIGAVVPSEALKSSVRALIVVYPIEANKPVILIDGTEITNLKCAAISALATDICAVEQANVLALIGSGTQARAQIRGVSSVRNLAQIRVYSRDPKNVENFIKQNQKIDEYTQIIACDSIKMALEGSDIISTATTSIDPLFSYQDLSAHHIHINCMGAHTRSSSELPIDIITNAKLIVEDVETAIAEAGDINKHAITLSELVHYDARRLKENITVFRSTGHAFLDLLTVVHVMKRLGFLLG
jgi:ornithine cyclodeaminase/alanine dehydrogenase-like protein (mu-crystallin family)